VTKVIRFAPNTKISLPRCNNRENLPSLSIETRVVKQADRRRTLQVALREEPLIAIPEDFERTFQAHSRLVLRAAYRVTGDAADAEDVLQTVFLRLLRRGPNALGLENEEGYLRRAAINAAIDLVRSRQADKIVPLLEIASSGRTPDGGDLRQALRGALARLDPRSANIFALRFFEDMNNREIASLLGISQVQVAVIVFRARRQLQKELRPYLGGRS
jgi:RNA polymerase sigma-70 factor (ECF subfamily)